MAFTNQSKNVSTSTNQSKGTTVDNTGFDLSVFDVGTWDQTGSVVVPSVYTNVSKNTS